MTTNHKTTPCSNCSSPVAIRRPSKSGNNYCQRSECQTAKQRFYRQRRMTEAAGAVVDHVSLLVSDLAHLERVECPCGVTNALPGWAHRDPSDPVRPCFQSGSQGAGLPKGMLDLIHPQLAPHPVA